MISSGGDNADGHVPHSGILAEAIGGFPDRFLEHVAAFGGYCVVRLVAAREEDR
jgi:hypothetical protein